MYNYDYNYSGCIMILILLIAYYVCFPLIFMLLWNWIVPIFWTTAPILNFWESFGVILLIRIIKSFFNIKK